MTNSPKRSLGSLPHDILLSIIAFLPDDRQSLTKLEVLSKAFYLLVKPLVWRSVTLHSADKAHDERMYHLIKFNLLYFVRRLVYRTPPTSYRLSAHLLGSFANLESLVLHALHRWREGSNSTTST